MNNNMNSITKSGKLSTNHLGQWCQKLVALLK